MVNGWTAMHRNRNLSRSLFGITFLQIYNCLNGIRTISSVVLATDVLETTESF